MRKRVTKNIFTTLTAFVVFVSFTFFSGSIAFADDDLDSVGEVSISSETISPPENVELFSSANASFTHDGNIEIANIPIKKEILVLFDSSFLSSSIPPDFIGIFDNCFFSINDLTLQGRSTEIEGDIFVMDQLYVKGSTEVNGNIKYKEIYLDGNNQSLLEGSGTKTVITDEEREETESHLNTTEDGHFIDLFNYIQGDLEERENYPDEEKAKYNFTNATKLIHFPDGTNRHDLEEESESYIRKEERQKEIITETGEKILQNVTLYNILGSDYFILRDSMYFEGDVKISVPNIRKELNDGVNSAFIFATGDIDMEGINQDLDEIDNIVLVSQYGNINFTAAGGSGEGGKSSIKTIAFAPNGNIKIQGDGIDFQGSFVANNIESIAGSSIFKGPSGDQIKDIGVEYEHTEGFDAVRSVIKHLPELFDDQSRIGVIKYFDYADINEELVRNNWRFYDNGDSEERAALQSYIDSLSANTNTKKSNLGDALRKAMDVFTDDDLSDSGDDLEKFIIIFSGLAPNAYTKNEDGTGFQLDYRYEATINDVPNTEDDFLDKANKYVVEMLNKINNYNVMNESNIHTVLVDLSLFRQESNLKDDGTPREIVPQLTNLAETILGVKVEAGDTEEYEGLNAYYRPSKEDIDNYAVNEFINKLTTPINNYKHRLAVEDLSIESAEFKLELPRTLKPVNMLLKDIFGNKFDSIDLSEITATGDAYIVEHNIDANISDFAKLKTTDEGETYILEAGEITIELYVNNDDGSLNGPELTIKKQIDSEGPIITYEFIDRDGNTYTHDVNFENIKFNVVYLKDIN